jgi:hypothetical protein
VTERRAVHDTEERADTTSPEQAAAELAVVRKMVEDAITVAHLGDMVAAHFGREDLTAVHGHEYAEDDPAELQPVRLRPADPDADW